MALIVITVQDTENGAVVSLAAEPAIDMSAPPVGEAQQLVHLMLAALPMNAEMVAPPVVGSAAEQTWTFEQFVQRGLESVASTESHMPWSFVFEGYSVTHENDDCYLLGAGAVTLRFTRGQLLVKGADGKLGTRPEPKKEEVQSPA